MVWSTMFQTNYDYPGPAQMVEFGSRGVDSLVTPNHEMYFRRYVKAMPPWEKQYAEWMLESSTNRYLFLVAPEQTEPGEFPNYPWSRNP